ncbi:calcium uniporter protein, mitochondrial [Copidosoma floridanum]|uniref:calcium uniporter protein, mitochondrial n=1 Tax=Copidosoma floridanum TaxID=29053 RepID=UPI000C6FB744|nr:calcium uniporter protein, mitochondrial [Copidosoma floridanum]
MASAGASCCSRAATSLLFRLELLSSSSFAGNGSCAGWATSVVLKPHSRLRAGQPTTAFSCRSFGSLAGNETWCKKWWNSSRKSLSTGTRTFTSSLNPILSKEQQHNYKESRDTRESKDTKKDSKETKESTKRSKEKSGALMTPEVTVEYCRGLPRITIPLPSRPDKCILTLKPISQTVGDFLDLIKQEDPAVVEASVTSTTGIKLGATNRIETMLLDDFNLIINDKVYPVSSPVHFESTKENILQMRDLQAMVNQIYESFNAREANAELEREVMQQLEEVRMELEPMEQEYMLPEVFRREQLIGLHKKAKKLAFDVERYNLLKDEAFELEQMLRLIRGPMHRQQVLVEQKRRERLEKMRAGSSSSSSSSRSPSSSPSPSPERHIESRKTTASDTRH